MKECIWITGAGGFSGRYLARYLRTLDRPLEIIGIGRTAAESADLDKFYAIDLTDAARVRKLARTHPPGRVFHLAGAMPPVSDAELWRVNVGGTQILLQTLAETNKKPFRVVTVGSAAEYYPVRRNLVETDRCGGETPYGRTKWAQTIIALACGRELGIDVMVARTFNLLGPGLSATLVAGSLSAQFSSRGAVKVGNTTALRDFVDVRDAVRAYWQISQKGKPGEIYNVATGQATTIKKLLALFVKVSGDNRRIDRLSDVSRRTDHPRICGNNSKLRRLGWSTAISLEQSVRDMLASRKS
ncbi:MAG: NAD-dependent epimerase/dehydratase family protein [Terriglobales bacterium]